jgi:hypothetical protein
MVPAQDPQEQRPPQRAGAGASELELRENSTLAARLRQRLNYSLLGLIALAVPMGVLVAYGAYGFRLAFGQFSQWVHDVDRISSGVSQLLLLTAGGLVFGLILKSLRWERFRGPANVIVAVHERDGRLDIKDGIITAACDALALGMGASVVAVAVTRYHGFEYVALKLTGREGHPLLCPLHFSPSDSALGFRPGASSGAAVDGGAPGAGDHVCAIPGRRAGRHGIRTASLRAARSPR